MRNLTAGMISEFSGNSVTPNFLADLFFGSATVRIWTGLGNLVWLGETYIGAGNLIGISPIDETQDLQAKGLVATLNGIPTTLISAALQEGETRGRPFRLYLGVVDNNASVATEDEPGHVLTEDGGDILLENNLLSTPYRIFSGIMDVMEYSTDAKTSSIKLFIENCIIIGQRPKIGRYTAEDQRRRFPNDKGLEYINQLQDKEVVW